MLQTVVILTTDHYTPGTYHDGVHHFVNFVPRLPADILPSDNSQHYDSVSFVYWRAIRQILYPGNIPLILLSTDYHQYSDVIKRQIVMGDRVRLMLNSI